MRVRFSLLVVTASGSFLSTLSPSSFQAHDIRHSPHLYLLLWSRLSDLSPLLTKDFHSWLIAFLATVTSCYLRHHLISSPTSLPPSTPSLLTGITPWRTMKHRCFFQACLHFLFFSLPSTLTLLSALKISSSHIRFSNPVAIALIFYCSIFTSYPDFP